MLKFGLWDVLLFILVAATPPFIHSFSFIDKVLCVGLAALELRDLIAPASSVLVCATMPRSSLSFYLLSFFPSICFNSGALYIAIAVMSLII